MSKIVKSPVPKWSGTVTFRDPLFAPQIFAIEDALDETSRLKSSEFLKAKSKKEKLTWSSRISYVYLKAIVE